MQCDFQSELEEEDRSIVANEAEAGEILLVEPKVGLGIESSSANNDSTHHYGFCAICLNTIVLQETALVKGCEHAYWFVLLSTSLLLYSFTIFHFYLLAGLLDDL